MTQQLQTTPVGRQRESSAIDEPSLDHLLGVALGEEPPLDADQEHRQYPRKSCDGWIGLVQIDAEGRKSHAVTMRAEDISAGGLGAYSWEQVKAGGHGAVIVRRPDGQDVLIGARVVYCAQRSHADWTCGLRFTNPPNDITIDDFRDDKGEPLNLGCMVAA